MALNVFLLCAKHIEPWLLSVVSPKAQAGVGEVKDQRVGYTVFILSMHHIISAMIATLIQCSFFRNFETCIADAIQSSHYA